jgi:hypothetical protein
MRVPSAILLAAALWCTAAQAGPAGPAGTGKPGIEPGHLRMVCDPARSDLRIFDPGYVQAPPVRPGERVREVGWSGLAISGKREVNGFYLRVGSQTRRLACGRLRLSIEEGYYHPSPGGRSGIYMFPYLRARLDGGEIARLQLDAGEDTIDTSGDCEDRAACPHTLRLLLCAPAGLDASGSACTGPPRPGRVRAYAQRWWFDDERKTHTRIDELK